MSTTPARVLIVDDHDDMRAAVALGLTRQGFTVVEASNGAEARAILEQGEPQLVLLDMHMPRMDGAQFLAEVATSAPVVLLSGDDEELAGLAKHPRVAAVLRKPVHFTELIAVVRKLCPNVQEER